jgi:hypothetical protein
MRSIQEQYNVVPGQYAKEMASVSVLPHLKSIAKQLAGYAVRPISAALGSKKENR